MRTLIGLVCAGMLLGPGRAGAADATEDAVRKAEEARFAATVKADFAALDSLLADDLTYTHSNTKVETKKELLDLMRSGHYKYNALQPEDLRVRAYGDTAVINGTAAVDVVSGGNLLKLKVRFTDVWVKRGGRWQLVAWQSTRIPEP
jgi:ketosteroid isomerase-like protein